MATAQLNFDGIQMEGARRRVDQLIRNEIDALDVAYYNFWRQDLPQAYRLWDIQSTPARSKLAFDILSGLLHHLTFLLQHLANCDHGGVNPAVAYPAYPEAKYNVVIAPAAVRGLPPVILETKVRATKRDMRALVDQWNTATLSPPFTRARWNRIVDFIRARPVIQEILTRRAALDSVLDIDNETDTAP